MIIGIITTLALSVSPPPTYDEIRGAAIHHCHRKNWYDVNQDIVDDLIEMEKHYFSNYNIPTELRGMLLAAACNESGYNSRAKGDWTVRKGRKIALAKGVVQLHSWWTTKYAVDRYDHVQSSEAWLKHIIHQRNKIDRKGWCKGHSNIKKWVVAWVQTTRGRSNKKNNFRCYQSPSHYKHLKRWYREIKKERKVPGC